MKALVLAALAAVMFTAHSAFAEDGVYPMVCISEDGQVGAEIDPGLGQINLIDGLRHTTYVETDFITVSVAEKILGDYRKEDRFFSFSVEVPWPVGSKLTYASLVSTSLITINYLPEGKARATFYGLLNGVFVTTEGMVELPKTRVRCEYLIKTNSNGVG